VDGILVRSGAALPHNESYSPLLSVLFDDLIFFRHRSFSVRIDYGVFVSNFSVVVKTICFFSAMRSPDDNQERRVVRSLLSSNMVNQHASNGFEPLGRQSRPDARLTWWPHVVRSPR
jgi:hypothetical protein